MPRNPRRNPSLTKSSKLIKVNSTPTSCFNIPIDLEIKILERLPVKTLVTITAVCKSWYSIVKNPRMLKRYHGLSPASVIDPEREGRAILMSQEVPDYSLNDCVVISQDSCVVREKLYINFLSDDWSYLTSIGSCCNGVLCVSLNEKVYLFNPSIRKLRPLPSSSTEVRIEKSGNEFSRFEGFGYDEVADDYKVVKVYNIYEEVESNYVGTEYDVKVEAEVYSLRSDPWKTVEANDHRYHFEGRCVSVNNAAHWLSHNHGNFLEMIVAFDFSDEVFREIVPPIDCKYRYTYMVSYKGSLAILVIAEIDEESEEDDESEEEQEEMSTVSLWIMKEYGVKESCSKEFTRVIHRSFDKAVNFTNNGKLMFWKKNSELAIWDPQTEKVVDLVGFSDKDYTVVEDYIESLVLY